MIRYGTCGHPLRDDAAIRALSQCPTNGYGCAVCGLVDLESYDAARWPWLQQRGMMRGKWRGQEEECNTVKPSPCEGFDGRHNDGVYELWQNGNLHINMSTQEVMRANLKICPPSRRDGRQAVRLLSLYVDLRLIESARGLEYVSTVVNERRGYGRFEDVTS